jgi:outer membrane protein assembly factor BamB
MHRSHILLASLFLLVVTARDADAQWTQFRGPNGSGVDSSAGYPVEFSPTKNVVWKIAVPYGQSSPVIVGTRLYLTASEGDRLLTICLDARSGRELWRREVRRDRVSDAYKANDPASPTPAADESGVVAFFPDFGLVSYSAVGEARWTSRLGPFRNFYGMAGSPIIAGGLVVLVCDQQSDAFVVALDRTTGRVKWRTERPGIRIGWATPIVFRPTSDRMDVIVLGSTRVDAYDLASGTQRWWVPVGAGDGLGTPLIAGDTVLVSAQGSTTPSLPAFATTLSQYDKDKDGRLSFVEFRGDKEIGEHFGWIDTNGDQFIVAGEWNAASSQYMGESGAVAVRPGNAKGRLEPGAIRWRFQKNIPYIPAPLLYRNVFYMVKTGGIVTTLDPATGKLLKEGRSPGALGEYYASPVAADGKVFLANTEGKIIVLRAAGEWEVLGVNDIGEEIHATPALSEGRIYVRTHDALYCFAASGGS